MGFFCFCFLTVRCRSVGRSVCVSLFTPDCEVMWLVSPAAAHADVSKTGGAINVSSGEAPFLEVRWPSKVCSVLLSVPHHRRHTLLHRSITDTHFCTSFMDTHTPAEASWMHTPAKVSWTHTPAEASEIHTSVLEKHHGHALLQKYHKQTLWSIMLDSCRSITNTHFRQSIIDRHSCRSLMDTHTTRSIPDTHDHGSSADTH